MIWITLAAGIAAGAPLWTAVGAVAVHRWHQGREFEIELEASKAQWFAEAGDALYEQNQQLAARLDDVRGLMRRQAAKLRNSRPVRAGAVRAGGPA